jgi:hypothetical protein
MLLPRKQLDGITKMLKNTTETKLARTFANMNVNQNLALQ